jgi:hypothetical protein
MIREFGSFKDLLGYVDSQIANYRKVLVSL